MNALATVPAVAARRRRAAKATAADLRAAEASDSQRILALVHDDELRERLATILTAAGLSGDLPPPPLRSTPSRSDGLVITDRRGLARVLDNAVGKHVLVLDDAPDARCRVRIMAAGADRVLDVRGPTEQLAQAIAETVASRRSTAEPCLADFFSSAPRMQELVATARLLVDAPSPILITGETGVGKEHLARAVHAAGPRANRPFLAVNCGALPENLLESVLFGHARGAFTGADRARRGVFEAAQDGTLLLDEIGEMPRHLQVKLLTALERREVVPLGLAKPVPVRARIMAVTNRDLAHEVERDRFRADLFYRLNVVHLDVPPLRARPEDIPNLLGRALHDLSEVAGTRERIKDIDSPALDALLGHAWPGNVRELRNAVERALVLGRARLGDRLDLASLPPEIGDPAAAWSMDADAVASTPAGIDPSRTLKDTRQAAIAAAERAYLDKVLRTTRGRIAKAARHAGISPRSLYDKMKRYGLRKEPYRHGGTAD